MPISAQYAWDICSQAAERGKHVRLTCDDGAVFEGIPSHVDFDFLVLGGRGFAHGQSRHLEILDD